MSLRVWMPSDVVRVELSVPREQFFDTDNDHAEDLGVMVLDRVADRWSIQPSGPSVSLWFEIDRQGRAAARRRGGADAGGPDTPGRAGEARQLTDRTAGANTMPTHAHKKERPPAGGALYHPNSVFFEKRGPARWAPFSNPRGEGAYLPSSFFSCRIPSFPRTFPSVLRSAP